MKAFYSFAAYSPAIAHSPRSYLTPGYLALSGLSTKAGAVNCQSPANAYNSPDINGNTFGCKNYKKAKTLTKRLQYWRD